MRQCRQLYAQGNALARRFHMCSDNVKVTILRSCGGNTRLTPSGNYMYHTIMPFVCYSCYPRNCSASGMFAVHNVMSCPVLVRKFVFGFYKRVKASQNSIVQAICASDIWWKSSIRANWNKLL